MASAEEVMMDAGLATDGISLIDHTNKQALSIGKYLTLHSNFCAAAKYTHCIFKMRREHLVNITTDPNLEITA